MTELLTSASLRWYELCTLFLSSVISELLLSPPIKDEENKEKRKWWVFPAYLGIYVFAACAAVFVYAMIRHVHTGASPWKVWWSYIVYLASERTWDLVLIPLAVKLLSVLTDIPSKPLYWTVTVIAAVLLFALSPYIIETYPRTVYPIEPVLLEELKKAPFPFETRFYDIEHFSKQIAKGYPRIPTPTPDASDEPEKDYEAVEDKPVESMTFRELIQCVRRYDIDGIGESPDVYLDRALTLFNAGLATNLNEIGQMWFFMGRYYHEPSHFLSAARCFEDNAEYFNTGLSYENYYNNTGEKEYFEKALDKFTEALSRDYENNQKAAESELEEIFVRFVGSGETSYMSFLDEICAQRPENGLLNTIHITYHLSRGVLDEADAREVDDLLSLNKYGNCPKLLLAKAYYSYSGGAEFLDTCSYVFSLYKSGDDLEYFEPEDRLNLAWMLYEAGEYVKAGMVASDQREVNESYESMVLLRAESSLQGGGKLSDADWNELYYTVDGEVGGLGAQRKDAVAQRLRISRAILAVRAGVDKTYEGLSEAYKSLFPTDSANGTYIFAALEYTDGNFAESIALCDQILESYDGSDYSYHKILFLKADALIELAKQTPDNDDRYALYTQAENALHTVEEALGNDYYACLERLEELYMTMPNRDSELQSVMNKLTAFQ